MVMVHFHPIYDMFYFDETDDTTLWTNLHLAHFLDSHTEVLGKRDFVIVLLQVYSSVVIEGYF